MTCSINLGLESLKTIARNLESSTHNKHKLAIILNIISPITRYLSLMIAYSNGLDFMMDWIRGIMMMVMVMVEPNLGVIKGNVMVKQHQGSLGNGFCSRVLGKGAILDDTIEWVEVKDGIVAGKAYFAMVVGVLHATRKVAAITSTL